MSEIGPRAVLQAFLGALELEGPDALAEYQASEFWTRRATRALVAAGRQLVPGGRTAAKSHPDAWDRREYLTLDVAVLPPTGWGAPALIAEHENSPFADRLQYDAWKLLSVIAETRILVAYFGGRRDTKTRGELQRRVEEVTRDANGRSIVLVSADYRAQPADLAELRGLYTALRIGRSGAR